MYTTVQVSGKPVKGITEFYCDSAEDINSLPTEGLASGSRATVIPTGQVFVLNCSNEWTELGSDDDGSQNVDVLEPAGEIKIIELDQLVNK